MKSVLYSEESRAAHQSVCLQLLHHGHPHTASLPALQVSLTELSSRQLQLGLALTSINSSIIIWPMLQ